MRKRRKNKKKTFEQRMMDVGLIPNVAAGIVVIIFVSFLVGLPREKIIPVVMLALCVVFVLQFIIAPITNKLITKNLSDDLEDWERYETTERERTKLLRRVMSCPQKIGLQVFLVFGAGAAFWVLSFDWFFNLGAESVFFGFVSIALGSYMALVLAMAYSQKLCSEYGCKLVAQGVDKEEVERKHSFGLSSVYMVLLHILFPIIIMNIIFILMAWRFSDSCPFDVNDSLASFVIVCIASSIFVLILSVMIYKRMMKSINNVRDMLESMDHGSFYEIKPTLTDLSNDFMYTVYLVNSIIGLIQNVLKMNSEINSQVVEAGSELSVVSKETAVTSLEQSSSIKELLATMEESDSFAREISVKIGEVASVARKTVEDVSEGFELLKQNMQKLDEIRTANETTLTGIKQLVEKIAGISDIAFIINSIADQTNIIAFNAEIEASSAGEAGKNFHLVANEIRRLTNSTIESTKEIRNKIAEIQQSSEELVNASSTGSKKIFEGGKLAEELKDNFGIIKSSSETTDTASEDIRKIIQQQTAAFEQIVVTLKQISIGADSFSDTTQAIYTSAEELCTEAAKLESIQPVLQDCENHGHKA